MESTWSNHYTKNWTITMLRQTAKEIKATFILPDGKYIANSLILKQKMHCTQPQPMEVSLLLTSIPQAQAFAFPFAFLAF